MADEFLVGQALTEYALCDLPKALAVVHGAIVVPERLFVKVPEQVKGLHVGIGAENGALEQAPEVSRPFVWTRPST